MKVPVFFHTPKGKNGIASRPHNVEVAPKHAAAVTRAFFDGSQRKMAKIWPHIDEGTKKVFAQLRIDPNDCVSGEISVSADALRRHAPELLG